MRSFFRSWSGKERATTLGVILGALYGIAVRFIVRYEVMGDAFVAMTVAFLVFVPLVIGYLTVYPVPQPTWKRRLLMPWLPCMMAVVGATITGWEGSICVWVSLPLLLVMASAGGVIGAAARARSAGAAAVFIALPFIVAPIESRIPYSERVQVNVTEIVVDAPAERVWQEVVTVPAIRPEEQRRALYIAIGFPRPISAELDRPGVGGIRHATFEGGVLFIETITDWEERRRIRFTIDVQSDSIPPTTLDPHVTIGGRYFDVLTGEYELVPLDGGRTRVVLTSTHRVSTTLDAYAGWWARTIMRSIQRNILYIIRDRAEGTSRVS